MVTKQDLFLHKLELLGGEANTHQMMEILDEKKHRIIDLCAYDLKRRGLIEITKRKTGKQSPACLNYFKVLNNKSNRAYKWWKERHQLQQWQ